MESFKFVGPRGSIDFSLASKYVFTSVEGLNGANTTRQENTYAGLDGADYSDILYQPEMLTIKGFICAGSRQEMTALRANLFRILNGKDSGTLFYKTGDRQYFTEVQTAKPLTGERMQNILPFTVYFERNKVLWKRNITHNYDIYRRENKLKTTFTLPCVFSTRDTVTTVYNGGDLPADSIITITGTTPSGKAGAQGIEIKNNTTGEGLYLDCAVEQRETITIDTANTTVISSLRGNMMNYLLSKSMFFKLPLGESEIEVVNQNPANELAATIQYYHVVLGV